MSRQLSFNPQKEFELIEYPAKVVNPDRMLTTLGGIINISKVNIELSKIGLVSFKILLSLGAGR